MHCAVKSIEGVVGTRPDAAVQCRQDGIAPTVEQPCRGQTQAKRRGVGAGDSERDYTADDDSRPDRAAMSEQDPGAKERRLDQHDVGRLRRVGGHDRLVLRLGRVREDVLHVEGERPVSLQPGTLGKRQQIVDVEVGVGWQRIQVAPVAVTRSAKAAPVMNRTSSPRSTSPFATASSGVTCPWTGQVAMMIDDIGSPSHRWAPSRIPSPGVRIIGKRTYITHVGVVRRATIYD